MFRERGSVPIINRPQAAILSAKMAVKRPVVDDAVTVRGRMNPEVSFDHRAMDGGAVLRFLDAVKHNAWRALVRRAM